MKNNPVIFICILILFFQDIIAQKLCPEQLSIQLNDALIHKNSKLLDELLHEKLTYGHSNMWIEDKQSLLANNESDYLVYRKIQCDSISSWTEGNTCILRLNTKISVSLQKKDIDLQLKVLQVWVKKKSKWKLLARQSVKVG